jgi:hypothetical protein
MSGDMSSNELQPNPDFLHESTPHPSGLKKPFERGGGGPLSPESLKKASFQQIQGSLRELANNHTDPNAPEVGVLKNAREMLIDRARGFGIFDDLKPKLAAVQQRVETRVFTYQEVIQGINNLTVDAANEEQHVKHIRVTNDVTQQTVDLWDDKLDGIALEYIAGARRVTEFVYADVNARLQPNQALRDTWRSYADEIRGRIQILNWGDIPEDDVYPLMVNVVRREIEEDNKRNANRPQPTQVIIEPPVQQDDTNRTRIPLPPKQRTEAEKEVFGEGNAFSTRWTRLHGIPDMVQPSFGSRFTRPFSPAVVLSELSATGLTLQSQLEQFSYTIDTAPDSEFRIAAMNGMLKLLNIDIVMDRGRVNSVADALREGPTPQGIAHWLLEDRETELALGVIFTLEGYSINGLNQSAILTDIKRHVKTKTDFADISNLTPDDVEEYLNATGTILNTDPGVVRLAYTIFRIMGFPHQNGKFVGLINSQSIDYQINNNRFQYKIDDPKKPGAKKNIGTINKNGDIDGRDLDPFLVSEGRKPHEKDGKLVKALREDGLDGFAIALNNVPAEQLFRYWGDIQLIIDTMDKVGDIRNGIGGAATMPRDKRHASIQGLQEFQTVLAKRKFSDATAQRILSSSKISAAPGAGEPTAGEREQMALRELLNIIPKKRPKSIK